MRRIPRSCCNFKKASSLFAEYLSKKDGPTIDRNCPNRCCNLPWHPLSCYGLGPHFLPLGKKDMYLPKIIESDPEGSISYFGVIGIGN